MGSFADPKHAEDEADRIIAENGLVHPVTMPAALRIISGTGIAQLSLMTAIAEKIVEKLHGHQTRDRSEAP